MATIAVEERRSLQELVQTGAASMVSNTTRKLARRVIEGVLVMRARRRFIRRGAMPALSLIIAGILVPQSAVSLFLFPLWQGLDTTWPLVDYPMYSSPHYVGERIPQLAVIATCLEMNEVELAPEDVGYGYWVFLRAFQSGDMDVVRHFIRIYETKRRCHVLELRLEDRGPLFTGSGTRATAPGVVLRRSLAPVVDDARAKE